MRKLTVFMLMAFLVLPAGTALGAINATSHDLSANSAVAEAGLCSPCHIPHGGGERLFPDPGVTGLGGGTVGQLCSTCHWSTGVYSASILGVAVADNTVYDTDSHGLAVQMTLAQDPDNDNQFKIDSGLPYTDDGTYTEMECTSCHNVHDDTVRPFLRGDIETICSMCHPNRHYDSTAGGFVDNVDAVFGTGIGDWGIANTRGANPGSHPIGDDVTAAMNGTWTTISLASGEFTVPIEDIAGAAGVGRWMLGGHLTRNGGVTCTTCHAVHGSEDDGDAVGAFNATPSTPFANFLQIEQETTIITYGGTPPDRTVASGYGGYNDLCEECHNGTPSGYTIVNGTWNSATVDPGATGYTHPLDGITPSSDNWVSAFPGSGTTSQWPAGDGTQFTAMDPVAICESCHVAHPQANDMAGVADRADVEAGAGAFILRDTWAGICANCHTQADSPSNHHPVGITFDGTDVAYLDNAGTATDVLSCSTCHSEAGAHNWAAANAIGLDDDWVPLDNARNYSTPSADAVAASMSETCMDCHFGADGDNTTYSPTMHDGSSSASETGYDFLGHGTHFMGDTVQTGTTMESATGAGSLNPQLTGVYTTAGLLWPTSIAGASGSGWSRFRQVAAGTTAIIVCESCHELEPDKNNLNGAHLLLANFLDQDAGSGDADGDTDGRDDFCESCHLPEGTHPMTGDPVDRTGVNMVVDFTKAWLDDPAATDATIDDSGAGQMSCDSCHQVHDANTASANFILEAPGTAANMATGDFGGTNPNGTTILVPSWADGEKGPSHEVFCQYCHGY